MIVSLLIAYAFALWRLSQFPLWSEIPILFNVPGFTPHGLQAKGAKTAAILSYVCWSIVLILLYVAPYANPDWLWLQALPYVSQLAGIYFLISTLMLFQQTVQYAYEEKTLPVSPPPLSQVEPPIDRSASTTMVASSEDLSLPSSQFLQADASAPIDPISGATGGELTPAPSSSLSAAETGPEVISDGENKESPAAESLPDKPIPQGAGPFLPFLRRRSKEESASTTIKAGEKTEKEGSSVDGATKIIAAAKRALPFSHEAYPRCLVGAEDEAALIPLLENPKLALAMVTTPFPAGIREMPSELVAEARETLPSLWIQPIHPELGPRITDQVNKLEEECHTQADKSIDALKEADQARTQLEHLNLTLQDLQQANQMLNAKLLSMRNRSRSTTGQEFEAMNIEQLNLEQEKLMYTLRRIDEERRKKKLAQGGQGA